MRKSWKALALACAFALTVSSVPAISVQAEVNGDGTLEVNEPLANNESIQPLPQGFQVDTLLKWTPESDPDARYARASIPLKKGRVTGPLVNKYANPEAKLMVCSLSNSNHDSTPVQGSEAFDSYAFGYWQYVDSMVYWAGSDEGIFVVPTPDIIDSAHKNGVPVTATIGFPWGPDDTEGKIRLKEIDKFVQQKADGSFPVADKMVEVAKYYGFDGYFFNQETYGGTAEMAKKMADMMKYVHKKYPEIIFNWYDSMCEDGSVTYQDAVTDKNKMWIEKDESGLYAVDEFFMNYNWGGANGQKTSTKYPDNTEKIQTTIDTMKKSGRSQYDAFAGFEVQQNSIATPIRDHLLMDENNKLKLSIALYCPNSTMGFSKDPVDFHEREKRFWVTSTGDPSNEPLNPADKDNWEWVGMARFFADKTIITKAPFVTNFNTGHGKKWFVDGRLSRTKEWNNRSVQDILPTWTWLVKDSSDGKKLDGAYDFENAYNGGNSIKFTGTLDNTDTIMLYSTDISNAQGADITYKVNKKGSKVELGVCYGDTYEEENFKYYELPSADAETWTTAHVDLSKDAGKKAIAVSLRINGKISGYQLNLGRLALTDKKNIVPSAPSKITIDEMMYNTANEAQVRMYWNTAKNADHYEIYRVNRKGNDVLINATPNNAYFIPNLVREKGQKSVTIKIVPVSADGTRGKAAVKKIEWAEDESSYSEAADKTSKNVALNAEVTGFSGQGEAEPAVKALDGTSLNGSKWCHAGVNEGWMSIKLKEPKTLRRWRVEHAEAGGEGAISNTIDFSLQYKDDGGEWQTAKTITNNTSAVTDVVLEKPITAQEWKLDITKADGGKWVAIRIYEWQMFESANLPPHTDIASHFASVRNEKGAKDSFQLTHVPADATVTLYSSLNKSKKLASGKPDKNGVVKISKLNLNKKGGKVFYTVKNNICSESSVIGAAYESETAKKTPKAAKVTFSALKLPNSKTTSSGYSNITIKGLKKGDIVKVYKDKTAVNYIKQSIPVEQGQSSVTLTQIPVKKGQKIYLEVKRAGMKISDRYAVSYK